MSELEILTEFKTQLINFFDELITQFSQEGDLVVMRIFITNQMSIEMTIDKFIIELNKNNQEFRTAIKNRDELFFLEYKLKKDTQEKFNLANFRKLWRSERLDNDDKNIIWDWFDTFLFLTDKYIKLKSA